MIGRDGRPVCRAKVVQWDHEALAADREALGLRGSPTRVKEIESVVLAQSEARMVEPDEAGINLARARADRGAHPWLTRALVATSGWSSSSTTAWPPR